MWVEYVTVIVSVVWRRQGDAEGQQTFGAAVIPPGARPCAFCAESLYFFLSLELLCPRNHL